jgi:hypothetical protein
VRKKRTSKRMLQSARGTDTQGILSMLESSLVRAKKFAELEDEDTPDLVGMSADLLERVKRDIDPEGWHVLANDFGLSIDGRLPGEKRTFWALKVKGSDKPASAVIECTRRVFEENVGVLYSQFVPSHRTTQGATGDGHVSAIRRILAREMEMCSVTQKGGMLCIEVPVAEAENIRRRLGG